MTISSMVDWQEEYTALKAEYDTAIEEIETLLTQVAGMVDCIGAAAEHDGLDPHSVTYAALGVQVLLLETLRQKVQALARS